MRDALNASLLSGARSRQHAVIERALALGADPNVRDEFGLTALHLVAIANDVRMMQVLIRHGANPSDGGVTGLSPMDSAVCGGRVEAMSLLGQHCLDLETARTGACGMLETALIARHFEAANWLIDHGADVEAEDARGATLLMRLLGQGREDAARLLAEGGAVVNDLALTVARRHCSADLELALRQYHRRGPALLASMIAPALGTTAKTEIELELQQSRHSPAKLLRRRAQMLQLQTARVLRSIGRQLPGFGLGREAMREVATRQWHELLQGGEILAAQAHLTKHAGHIDFALAPHFDASIWHLLATAAASARGVSGAHFIGMISPEERALIEMAQAIEAAKPSRSAILSRDALGGTALHALIDIGHARLVMHLLSLSSWRRMVNASNARLQRPLHLSVLRADPHLMSALIDAGGNLNAFDRRGDTPLLLAAQLMEHRCAETAISAGANILLRSHDGKSFDSIISHRKDQFAYLQQVLNARREMDRAKSIFSSHNPLAGAVRSSPRT